MDNALKQRILGVIVLFALIGICITVLLHNNKVSQRQQMREPRHHLIAQTESQPTEALPPPPTLKEIAHAKPTPATSVSSHEDTTTTTVKTTHVKTSTPSTASVFGNTNETPTTKPVVTHPLTSQAMASIPSVHKTTTLPRIFNSTETTKTTKPEKTLTTKTFSVQVGTFSNRENATALVKALHGRGFAATTQSVKVKHGEMTRVVIGEKGLTRKEAESIKLRLNKSLHLTGIISPVGKTTENKTSTPVAHKKNVQLTHAKKATHKTITPSKPAPVIAAKPTLKKTTPSQGAPVTVAKPSFSQHKNILSKTTHTSTSSKTTSDNSGAVVIP